MSNYKSIFLTPTSDVEVHSTIMQLKDITGGVNGINVQMLKSISSYKTISLEYIFNTCIKSSACPDALKTAVIVPIYKSGDKRLPSIYRPISLIWNLAKVLEKIIRRRLYKFVKECEIISNKQYDFLKNRGTKDALYSINNLICDKIDNEEPVITEFLYLAKAFDTVNQEILLNKLDN